ncbi:MAG: hypothetical protein ACRDQ7_05840, partial [Haloechinothrix sp.]
TAPAPAPAPLPADLAATGPEGGITVVPGAEPTDLPITVRNDGETTSDPVVVTLTLPEGIAAVDPAGGGSQPGSARAGTQQLSMPVARQAEPATETVRCPGGTGEVSCSTREGLEPGESVILLFRVVADEDAAPGEITGTVSSGTLAPVRITVQVRVAQDDVELHVRGTGPENYRADAGRILHITVHNTGESTKPVTVHIDRAALGHPKHQVTCTEEPDETTCESNEPLRPDEKLTLQMVLTAPPDPGLATVTATLGDAQASEQVFVDCLGPASCDNQPPEPPEEPGKQTPPSAEKPDPKTPGMLEKPALPDKPKKPDKPTKLDKADKASKASKHRSHPLMRAMSSLSWID